MNSIIQIKFLCCVVTILIVSCSVPEKVSISTDELNDVGKRIFQNEASGKYENLIVWNKGEDFASLGIGGRQRRALQRKLSRFYQLFN